MKKYIISGVCILMIVVGCKDVEKNPSVNCIGSYEYRERDGICTKYTVLFEAAYADFNESFFQSEFVKKFLNLGFDSNGNYDSSYWRSNFWNIEALESYITIANGLFFQDFELFELKRKKHLNTLIYEEQRFKEIYGNAEYADGVWKIEYMFENLINILETNPLENNFVKNNAISATQKDELLNKLQSYTKTPIISFTRKDLDPEGYYPKLVVEVFPEKESEKTSLILDDTYSYLEKNCSETLPACISKLKEEIAAVLPSFSALYEPL